MEDKLPKEFEAFFWDCDFTCLAWSSNRDFIIRRILTAGSWQAISWLRVKLGDANLRQWLEQHGGAGLSPRQLRFWEMVLDLPRSKVTRWVRTAKSRLWESRIDR